MTIFVYKVLAVLSCLTVMLMQPSCFRDSYEVEVAGPTEITDQWLEIQPKQHFKSDKDYHLIVLDLEPPFKYDLYREGKEPNKGQGILTPEGDVINPQLQVIDQTGKAYDLVYAGARRNFWPAYGLPSPNKWPTDREYTSIRIRSPRRIKCKAIYWFAESNKDLK